MKTSFTLLYDQVADTVFLRPVGDLDLTTAQEVVDATSRAFASPGSNWTILDLTAVLHIDAYGMRALGRISERAKATDHRLRIRCHEPLHRLIERSGVDIGCG